MPLSLDGSDAEVQIVGNQLVRLACHQRIENGPLAIRKFQELRREGEVGFNDLAGMIEGQLADSSGR